MYYLGRIVMWLFRMKVGSLHVCSWLAYNYEITEEKH